MVPPCSLYIVLFHFLWSLWLYILRSWWGICFWVGIGFCLCKKSDLSVAKLKELQSDLSVSVFFLSKLCKVFLLCPWINIFIFPYNCIVWQFTIVSFYLTVLTAIFFKMLVYYQKIFFLHLFLLIRKMVDWNKLFFLVCFFSFSVC